MKANLLFILLLITISCKNGNAVDSQIEEIIFEYSRKYELKTPNVAEKFSAKQSYEIGFFKNNEMDTLFYIGFINSYALKEFSVIFSSTFSAKLEIEDHRILDYPLYIGSFFNKKDSLPIHVFDVIDKLGRGFYDFNKLNNFNFKDFFITEEYFDSYPPNLWIYKIKNNNFTKIAETDTMSYDIKRLISPEILD